jgi:hypothetical protein
LQRVCSQICRLQHLDAEKVRRDSRSTNPVRPEVIIESGESSSIVEKGDLNNVLGVDAPDLGRTTKCASYLANADSE